MKVSITRTSSSYDIGKESQYAISASRWWGWKYIGHVYATSLDVAKTKAVAVVSRYREESKPEIFEV